jgi:peptidylprolyl isomerase
MPHIRYTLALAVLAAMLAAPSSNARNCSAAGGDTITTPSGLRYVITHHGTGAAPEAGNYPIVHYTGTLANGTVFDDSRKRDQPFAFKLGAGQVIKGWDEGIALLHIGDRATFIIPSELGYGAKGAGAVIPPNATLVFDVELLDVKKQTVGGMLAEALDSKGAAAAEHAYKNWKKGRRDAYYLSEAEVNALGYRCLKEGKNAEAIAVFKINTDLFPKSGNVYDSLAEAYMTAGNNKLAIANYERSLKLDPHNLNASEMLTKLRGER